jgi:predicted nucleic acid-binding protein
VILIDTSGLLAALFDDQNDHEECAEVLLEAEPPRILSPYVVAEADFLIHKYGGMKAELAFLQELARGVYELPSFDESDIEQAREIIVKYRTLQIGLADASIAVLAARYECRDVLTLDQRHFRAIRHSGRRVFRVLPADGD